jgi:hypothetical protein
MHLRSRRRSRVVLSIAVGAVVALSLSGGASSSGPGGGVGEINVLSNRADLISGGDALVSIDLIANVRTVRVELNGANVTSSFAVRDNGKFEGLVTGLVEGDNLLRVRPANGVGRSITIKNHPIGGPVFSGPQVQPWLCRTQNQTNPTLGPSTDAQCNAPTKVELFYRNLSNPAQFVAYDPANPPAPEAIQQTTTDQGKTVPFIVERVTGTANRGIYQFALLVDPTKNASPWTEQPWNRKYINSFGGACSVNYQQPTVGNQLGGFGPGNADLLGRGFAVGTSSLNTYGNQCNDIISAEALMMTKEILTERHGPIRYTIGNGGSAGTMQQHLITEAYPGLLNGIATSLLYEDHWYQVLGSSDCILLWRYFGLPNAAPPFIGVYPPGLLGPPNTLFPTAADRQKVWGSNPAAPDNLCGTKIGFTITELVADHPFGCSGPAEPPLWRWHAVNNPMGSRCTSQDYQKNLFGVDPVTGKAPTPVANEGVQYGLKTLLDGTLTAEQFVDANYRIGSLNIDGVWQPQRSAGDARAVADIYRTGRFVSGRGTASVAEIEVRNNTDDTGFHPPFHTFTYRARVDRANGNHDTHVAWVVPPAPNNGQTPDQVLTIDKWLAAVEADTSEATLEEKLVANKPAEAVDTCFPAGGVTRDVMCTDPATGVPGWQYYGNPRLQAGGNFTLDHFQCQRKPLNPADYPVSFTSDQWLRLMQAFPTGVCDYEQTPVGYQPSIPWMTFADGSHGTPLGDPPTSDGPSVTGPGGGN